MIIRIKRVGPNTLWIIVKSNKSKEPLTFKDEWDQYMPVTINPGETGTFSFSRKIKY